MRILILNHEFPPAGGGAANAALAIGRALVGLGHDPWVVTQQHPRHGHSIAVPPFGMTLVPPRRRSLDTGSIAEMMGYIPSATLAGIYLYRKHRFDGCVAFFSFPGGAVARALNVFIGLPYVVLLRGGDVPGVEPDLGRIHRCLRPVRHSIYRHARRVAANAAGLQVVAQDADPGFFIGLIPNGVDTGEWSPAEWTPAPPPLRLLFAGRLNRQKGLRILLDAFAQFSHDIPGMVHLDIVGDGPERAMLEGMSHSLGLAATVKFHGWQEKTALRDLYRESHLFVNPSLYEGMPNTVLEALASGLPVVASDIPGNRELLHKSGAGWLFPSGDSCQLARCLTEAYDCRFRWQKLSASARGAALLHFSWEQTAESLAGCFTER